MLKKKEKEVEVVTEEVVQKEEIVQEVKPVEEAVTVSEQEEKEDAEVINFDDLKAQEEQKGKEQEEVHPEEKLFENEPKIKEKQEEIIKKQEEVIEEKEGIVEKKMLVPSEDELKLIEAEQEEDNPLVELFGIKSNELMKIQREAPKVDEKEKSAQELLERQKEFLESLKKKESILWSTLQNARMNNDAQGNPLNAVAILNFNGFEVNIIDNDYFMDNFEFSQAYKTKNCYEQASERLRVMGYHLNATICFTIEQVITIPKENRNIIIGSRKKAMAMLQDIYFYHSDKAKKKIDVKEEDVTKARVISVRSKELLVECMGVETRIDYKVVSNESIKNCRDHYHAGDEITVRVKTIHPHQDYIYLAVVGLINPLLKELTSLKKGDLVVGEIIKYNDQKKLYTVRLKNGLKLSCFSKTEILQDRLINGDKVLASILYINEQYALGRILRKV